MQDSSKTGAVVRSGMLVNKQKGRELAEKNGEVNVKMNPGSVVER